MPGEPVWQSNVGQQAYNAVLGGVTSGGIIVASLVAYFAGEFSNSYVLARLKVLTAGRLLWTRTIGSTIVGELVDTVLFVVIASAFGVFPWEIALSIIVANYIFKVGIEVLLTPITYRVVNALKSPGARGLLRRSHGLQPFRLWS